MISILILLIAVGNPFCKSGGYDFNLQPSSPAIDAGVYIQGIHCKNPGPGQGGDGTCLEWYGRAPDIGACEVVQQATAPFTPSNLVGKIN